MIKLVLFTALGVLSFVTLYNMDSPGIAGLIALALIGLAVKAAR